MKSGKKRADPIAAPQLKPHEFAAMYRAMRDKTLKEVANEFGLLEHYQGSLPKAVSFLHSQVYRKVSLAPEKYGVSEEFRKEVHDAISNRAVVKRNEDGLYFNNPTTKNDESTNLITSLKDKVIKLAHAKVDRIMSSKKNIDEANMSTIFTSLGIIFDKSQIATGQATENIAMIAKVNDKLTAEEAMKIVLQNREQNQERFDRAKKKK